MNTKIIMPRIRIALKGVPERDIEALESLLKHYQAGQYVYPNVVSRHLSVSREQALEYLDTLSNIDILNRGLELHCFSCNRSVDMYISLADAQTFYSCPHCDQEINTKDSLLPIYRVNQ